MTTNFSGKNMDRSIGSHSVDERVSRVGLKFFTTAASIAIAAVAFTGCAGDYYVAGYGPGYYAPDYAPYYGDYGYGGYPYWGPGPYYGAEIITGGVRHRASYGWHHFPHEQGRGGPRGGHAGVSHAPTGGGGPPHRQ
ncbi:MAG: hypothetical protein ACREIF_16395 [Chthoniobacterales bacterium]